METRIGQHLLHRLISKAEPGMGMDGTQFLALMRGKIDNCDAAVRPRHSGGFRQHPFRCLRIVQHLMQGHRIEHRIAERQSGEISLHQFDPFGGAILEPGAGQCQHIMAAIERGDMVCPIKQQFRNPPGTGTDIEQTTQFQPQSFEQRLLDQYGIAQQGTQLIPLRGMDRKIIRRARRTGITDGSQPCAICLTLRGECRVFPFRRRQQCFGRRGERGIRRGLRQTTAHENPAPFAMPFGQARVAQDLHMPRNTWLALRQNLDDLANRKLHTRQQPHDPQAAGIGQGPKERFNLHG